MTKNNILPVDVIHTADTQGNPENMNLKSNKHNLEIEDIDELIFPEEYFYISQR